MKPSLTIIADTYLKPGAEASVSYPVGELAKVLKGTIIPIVAYREESGHICLTIDATDFNLANLHPSRRNTWWVYASHCMDPSGHDSKNNPTDQGIVINKGYSIKLPGFVGDYHSNDPIGLKAPNFTWGEALHIRSNGDYRQPANSEVVHNILRVAEVVQKVRDVLEQPIRVTSWYRDPVTNRQVGGASQSRHIVGDAVDFSVDGVSLVEAYKRLDPWWASRGGLARGAAFIHIDCRGYRARWNYPGVK